jgi:hypothetical protein
MFILFSIELAKNLNWMGAALSDCVITVSSTRLVSGRSSAGLPPLHWNCPSTHYAVPPPPPQESRYHVALELRAHRNSHSHHHYEILVVLSCAPQDERLWIVWTTLMIHYRNLSSHTIVTTEAWCSIDSIAWFPVESAFLGNTRPPKTAGDSSSLLHCLTTTVQAGLSRDENRNSVWGQGCRKTWMPPETATRCANKLAFRSCKILTGSLWRRQSQQSFNTLTPFNFLFHSLHVSAPMGHPQVRYTISYYFCFWRIILIQRIRCTYAIWL